MVLKEDMSPSLDADHHTNIGDREKIAGEISATRRFKSPFGHGFVYPARVRLEGCHHTAPS